MASLKLRLESLEDNNPWIIEQKTFDILNEYLQPFSTSTPEEAARDIDNLTPMKRPDQGDGKEKEGPESFLWETWGIFQEIAKQIPHDHASQARLVLLVNTLRTLPPTTVTIWTASTRLWTGLLLMGRSMREAWISPTYYGDDPTPESARQWINLNSYAARILELRLAIWKNFAIWSLIAALEEPERKYGPLLDCDVAAAAEWIIHGGDSLFDEISETRFELAMDDRNGEEGNEGTHQRQQTPVGPLYKGKAGCSLDRWRFWKQRFGEVGKLLGAEVKGSAIRAQERMTEIKQNLDSLLN